MLSLKLGSEELLSLFLLYGKFILMKLAILVKLETISLWGTPRLDTFLAHLKNEMEKRMRVAPLLFRCCRESKRTFTLFSGHSHCLSPLGSLPFFPPPDLSSPLPSVSKCPFMLLPLPLSLTHTPLSLGHPLTHSTSPSTLFPQW